MFLKNIICLFISGVLATLSSFLLNNYTTYQFQHSEFFLVYFLGLFFISNVLYTYTATSTAFTEIILSGLVAKLLISLIVIVLYSLKIPDNFFNISVHFILHYIIFTLIGIKFLFIIIKQKQTT